MSLGNLGPVVAGLAALLLASSSEAAQFRTLHSTTSLTFGVEDPDRLNRDDVSSDPKHSIEFKLDLETSVRLPCVFRGFKTECSPDKQSIREMIDTYLEMGDGDKKPRLSRSFLSSKSPAEVVDLLDGISPAGPFLYYLEPKPLFPFELYSGPPSLIDFMARDVQAIGSYEVVDKAPPFPREVSYWDTNDPAPLLTVFDPGLSFSNLYSFERAQASGIGAKVYAYWEKLLATGLVAGCGESRGIVVEASIPWREHKRDILYCRTDKDAQPDTLLDDCFLVAFETTGGVRYLASARSPNSAERGGDGYVMSFVCTLAANDVTAAKEAVKGFLEQKPFAIPPILKRNDAKKFVFEAARAIERSEIDPGLWERMMVNAEVELRVAPFELSVSVMLGRPIRNEPAAPIDQFDEKTYDKYQQAFFAKISKVKGFKECEGN